MLILKLLCSLATEWERRLTTARANQTTGLTNGRAENWVPEVEFSPFRALTRRQMTFPSFFLNRPTSVITTTFVYIRRQ